MAVIPTRLLQLVTYYILCLLFYNQYQISTCSTHSTLFLKSLDPFCAHGVDVLSGLILSFCLFPLPASNGIGQRYRKRKDLVNKSLGKFLVQLSLETVVIIHYFRHFCKQNRSASISEIVRKTSRFHLFFPALAWYTGAENHLPNFGKI